MPKNSSWNSWGGSPGTGNASIWEPLFGVHGKEFRAENLKEQRLDDKGMEELATYLKDHRLPSVRWELKLSRSSPLQLKELRLGKNEFGLAGAEALVNALLDSKVSLRKLWLEKNRLGVGDIEPVAKLIEEAPAPLVELHLSHNYLGKGDVQRLVTAAGSRAEYPVAGKLPLWLRVERQQDWQNWKGFGWSENENLAIAKDMMASAGQQLLQMRRERGMLPTKAGDVKLLCLVPWVSGGCKAGNCNHIHQYGPIVHLPYFWHQGEFCTKFQDTPHSRPQPAQRPHSDWSYPTHETSSSSSWKVSSSEDAQENHWMSQSWESHHTGSAWADSNGGWHSHGSMTSNGEKWNDRGDDEQSGNRNDDKWTHWRWLQKEYADELRELEALIGEECGSRYTSEPAESAAADDDDEEEAEQGNLSHQQVRDLISAGAQQWPAWAEVAVQKKLHATVESVVEEFDTDSPSKDEHSEGVAESADEHARASVGEPSDATDMEFERTVDRLVEYIRKSSDPRTAVNTMSHRSIDQKAAQAAVVRYYARMEWSTKPEVSTAHIQLSTTPGESTEMSAGGAAQANVELHAAYAAAAEE